MIQAFGLIYLTLLAATPTPAGGLDFVETISVDLRVRTGGELSGLVVDHNAHGLVIVRENIPYVFGWRELESGCAYLVRRDLVARARGGLGNLSGEDHIQLAEFALSQDRGDLAARSFRAAIRLDRAYEVKAKQLRRAYRRSRETSNGQRWDEVEAEDVGDVDVAEAGASADAQEASGQDIAGEPMVGFDGVLVPSASDATAEAVMEAYRRYGEKVREVISKRIELVETEHFLIWTDWGKRDRVRLGPWCEAMYRALCTEFAVDPGESVFLAKCPVFCFRAKLRFLKFSRLFDGYDGRNASGYTRSIEQSGHVHLALLLRGNEPDDFDRFATTLIHEGTHAFLHRLHTNRLIPPWVNEGFADLVAERVLGDRCPTGENAALLALQYARYDWPIGDLLRRTEPLAVHEYPLAHSVVAYLEQRRPKGFPRFIELLKAGQTSSEALALAYGGITLDQLEVDWRAAMGRAVVAIEERSVQR